MSKTTQGDWLQAKKLFENGSPSFKDVALKIADVRIPLEARIEELEQSMKAFSALECAEFEYQDQLCGIDQHGCYQIGSDGARHDAPPRYVLLVAKQQIQYTIRTLLDLNGYRLLPSEEVDNTDD